MSWVLHYLISQNLREFLVFKLDGFQVPFPSICQAYTRSFRVWIASSSGNESGICPFSAKCHPCDNTKVKNKLLT